jgi:hypothetical protein
MPTLKTEESSCLDMGDHIPRCSMALLRVKSLPDELIGGLPPRSLHGCRTSHKLQSMNSRIHPKPAPPRQEIKDSGLSDR